MAINNRRHTYVSATAATGEASVAFRADQIEFVANDGSDDLIVNFDEDTSQSTAITIKAGEILDDVDRAATTLFHKRGGSADVAFRAMGVY